MPDNTTDEATFEIAQEETTFFSAFTFAFQNDEKLSLQAKGLLAMLLSFGRGWKIYMKDIAKRSSSGRYVLAAAVRELATAGYLTKKPIKAAQGRFAGWKYTVFQTPKVAQTQKGQGADGVAVLPHAVNQSHHATACGKTDSDKYLQPPNSNKDKYIQQQSKSAVIEELRKMKITDEGIAEIRAALDETTIMQLISYARKHKLGSGWLRSAARSPEKRPAPGLLEAEAAKNETSATSAPEFVDKAELSRRAAALIEELRCQ